MRILLRKFDDEVYIWKDCIYKGNAFFVEDNCIDIVNIVSVEDDNRSNYVICNSCGEMILNNKRSIEAHGKKKAKEKNCLCCSDAIAKTRNISPIVKIVPVPSNGEGEQKYKVTNEYVTDVVCGKFGGYYSYAKASINTPEADAVCKYLACASSGTRQINDLFTRYPGIFDTIITVDRLVEAGCTYHASYGHVYTYDVGYKGCLYAIVNKCGYVDHFEVTHRNDTFWCYYSKEYDMLVWYKNGSYREIAPSGMSQSKIDAITKKIRKLYDGIEVEAENTEEETENE